MRYSFPCAVSLDAANLEAAYSELMQATKHLGIKVVISTTGCVENQHFINEETVKIIRRRYNRKNAVTQLEDYFNGHIENY